MIEGLPAPLVVVPTWTEANPDRGPYWAWHAAVREHREKVATRLAADPSLWPAERERVRRYGAKYFAAMHLSVYEPRTDSDYGRGQLPFIPHPFQITVLDFLAKPSRDRISKVIDKPREVGVTTITLADSLWHWLVDAVWDETWISATEDDVDKKDDKDSNLVKLDMLIATCPDPLLPKLCRGFNPWAPRYPRWRKHLNIINPDSGASINGHATTKRATRGGRRSRIDLDEGAFWEVGMLDTLSTALGTSHDVVVMSSASTEYGRDFKTLVESTSQHEPDNLMVIFDWEHPLWTADQTDADQRRYHALGEVGQMAWLRERKGVGEAGVDLPKYPEASDVPLDGKPLDPSRPVYCFHDPGRDGDYAIILAQLRAPDWLDICLGWKARQHREASYDAKMIGYLLAGYAPSGRGFPWTDRDLAFAELMNRLSTVIHFGDPYGDQKGATDGWYKEEDLYAREASNGRRRVLVRTRLINADALPPGQRDVRALPVREAKAKQWLKQTHVYDHPYAVEVINAIRALNMQRVPRNRPRVTEPYQTYHDSDPTHYAQAYEFGVVHLDVENAARQAAEQQRRSGPIYANPHGLTVPTVGTVPTVRRPS